MEPPNTPDPSNTDFAYLVDAPVLTLVPGGIPDLEATPKQIAARGEGLRLRLAAQLYVDGSYVTWEAVRWGLTFGSVEQMARFRVHLDQAMRSFVDEETAMVAPPPDAETR